MGSRYLTDLADVCRSLGLPTIEVGASPSTTGDAWKKRARGSGGYNEGLPNHVMCHHTASSTSASGWQDANYCTFSNENRPVCNLLIARDGVVFVCAGGATNTNGSGSDPCGMTPSDSMNSQAIGIEASNNGVGEKWPQVQTDRYLILVRGLCDHYNIPISCAHSHEEWAPTRKVDPAGPPRWNDPSIWNMDEFRADLTSVKPEPEPEPEPDREDDDMLHVVAYEADGRTVSRGPALVGPGYWHFARNDDEAFVWKKVYGQPRQLDNAYDFDTLVRTMALEPDDDRQLGPGA
jgi:hypothetical protein